MWSKMRSAVFLSILSSSGLVRSAININGTQAVDAVTEEDPSPIADINTYYPDQHDCPLLCVDYANIHSWITYFSVERLRRCNKPMLLQIPVSQPLNDPDTTTLIRSCTLSGELTSGLVAETTVENPKTQNALAVAKLASEPSCVSPGTATSDKVQLLTGGPEENDENVRAVSLLKGMQEFFDVQENCDEQFVFAYFNETVTGAYIGRGLGKGTIKSSLHGLTEKYAQGSFPSRVVAEVCGNNGTDPGHVFGVTIENSRNLASVQRSAWEWSKGNCLSKQGLTVEGDLPSATVLKVSLGGNDTFTGNSTHTRRHSRSPFTFKHALGSGHLHHGHNIHIEKRAACTAVTVADGDTCPSLVKKCGTTSPLFVKYNPKSSLCSTLKKGDLLCCTAGDLPTSSPTSPKPDASGTCATHLIASGDTCSALATRYGVTVENIEKWNKGKTWAWTVCAEMLVGYNMCVSDGFAPMPPPQQGAECGPLVPGTQPLTDRSKSLADLNPCPLKACCSNWGFCGVFPSHCEKHAPEGGGPGTKLKQFQNTCVSNCDNEIKKNSDAPAKFQRIGYYESWNMNRDCLWLKAENANTDGSYTHIHWGFAEIDSTTFKVILKDEHKQWAAFKNLTNVKRIVSLGGWAYSTENPGASIMRNAILNNRQVFAANLAQFAKDEGIDGIDIDWEYPGAPDIAVDGNVISTKTDGIEYLKFLTTLKQNMGDKLVSIAAPASYWYLKAFPIDRIAKVIDYIVYMTYDLHGQWDYGNPNSFDQCDSGKCIRSHVNLTETTNSLAMITKAGVPNNKIFVGESSYGRSFRMAKDGCWSAMCEFTGSRTFSDATPGRCTNTSGYLAQAEILELIRMQKVRKLYDPISNSNVVLYNGDYISYLDKDSKISRQARWKGLNFAGTIDWAVDLQSFSDEDRNFIPDRPKNGKGCVAGSDITLDSWDLCEFTCSLGFCPETVCQCLEQGELPDLPAAKFDGEVEAFLPSDVDLNRLCKFSCKYGHCPEEVCLPPVVDEEVDEEENPIMSGIPTRDSNNKNRCMIWKGISEYDNSVQECKSTCKSKIDEAEAAGRTTNYGCIATFNGQKTIQWNRVPNGYVTPGTCLCDNWLLNELADTVLEALPMIAQVGCYIIMSSLKFVLDLGAQFVPVVGKALDAGLDMAMTAAQMAAYLYPEEEDPEGAFSWWLQPCGGTDLVPEEIKKVFGILSQVADGVSSFVEPKKLKKGQGKKGDDANPEEKDRSTPGTGVAKPKTQRKCYVAPGQKVKIIGPAKNVLQTAECKNGNTHLTQLIITTLTHVANPQTYMVEGKCSKNYNQACFHYSSAISVSPQWATMTCHVATNAHRENGAMTEIWSKAHGGDGWQDRTNRVEKNCGRDEYPPAYFMNGPQDPILVNGGVNPGGQLMRWLPQLENAQAANMWKGACFKPPLAGFTEKDFNDNMARDLAKQDAVEITTMGKQKDITKTITVTKFSATVQKVGEFSIAAWEPKPRLGSDDGLKDNDCWPKKIAPLDPGFVLLHVDPWYNNKDPPYKYDQAYDPPNNGA